MIAYARLSQATTTPHQLTTHSPLPDDRAFEFTNHWFAEPLKQIWAQIFSKFSPRNLLEIGSFEGASACHLIGTLGSRHPIRLTCIDSWESGAEHRKDGPFEADMPAVEARFQRNIRRAVANAAHLVELDIRKGPSDAELCKLIAEGKQESFDFIYVDGSHQACDVICDAVLSFRRLSEGGIIIFDDYLWRGGAADTGNPLKTPKLAIDAFINLHFDRLQLLSFPLYQVYARKTVRHK